MMIDTSALTAILRQESDKDIFARRIRDAEIRCLVSPTYLELCMVITGQKGQDAKPRIDAFLEQLEVSILPFTPTMAKCAAEAFALYGKGRNTKASLNFGDCIAYAASKVEMMPLLFKGDDFRNTDVECAL